MLVQQFTVVVVANVSTMERASVSSSSIPKTRFIVVMRHKYLFRGGKSVSTNPVLMRMLSLVARLVIARFCRMFEDVVTHNLNFLTIHLTLSA